MPTSLVRIPAPRLRYQGTVTFCVGATGGGVGGTALSGPAAPADGVAGLAGCTLK
jgi:hypothetical protein